MRGSGTSVAQQESTMAKTALQTRSQYNKEKTKRKILANFLAVSATQKDKKQKEYYANALEKHSYISNACV